MKKAVGVFVIAAVALAGWALGAAAQSDDGSTLYASLGISCAPNDNVTDMDSYGGGTEYATPEEALAGLYGDSVTVAKAISSGDQTMAAPLSTASVEQAAFGLNRNGLVQARVTFVKSDGGWAFDGVASCADAQDWALPNILAK